MDTKQKQILAWTASGIAVAGIYFAYRYRSARALTGAQPPELPAGDGWVSGPVGQTEEMAQIEIATDARGDVLGQRAYQQSLEYARRCGLQNPEQWASRTYVEANAPCHVRLGAYYQIASSPSGPVVQLGLFPPGEPPATPFDAFEGGGWLSGAELCAIAQPGNGNEIRRNAARRYLSNDYDKTGALIRTDITGTAWRTRCGRMDKKG